MCGRFGLWLEEGFYERFGVERSDNIPSSYNTAPGMNSPVITRNSPNRIQIMKWGLIPPWAKDPRIGFRMINAKAETITEKPAYRHAFRSQRCIVPMNGFYEWRKMGTKKVPYFFHDTKKHYLAAAGLYEIAHDAEGKEIKSFTIITTDANAEVHTAHERMPVLLSTEAEGEWLDKENDTDELRKLLKPYESEFFEGYEVSDRVNSAMNDDKELVKKVS